VSDFLTNLAARTIATPSLRPRSRMRFEPAAAEPMVTLPDLAHDEAPAAPTAPALPRGNPPVRQPAAFAPRTEREPPAAPTAPMQAEVVAPLQYDAAPPAAADTADEPQPIREPARPPRIVNVPTTAPERIVELPAQAAETIVERVTETRAVPSIKRIAIDAETPAERPHRYDEQEPRIESVAPAYEEERSETAPDRSTPSRPSTAARPRNAFFPMPAESSTPAAPEREAVVQVSIGRIEVRAVRPTAAPRAAERANPIMTINEYMARRKGRP
jgi:hypothetical protein